MARVNTPPSLICCKPRPFSGHANASALYKDREAFDIADAVTITSHENFRSPRALVKLINGLRLTTTEVEALCAHEGELPDPIVFEAPERIGPCTVKAVERCLRRGFSLDDIAIASMRMAPAWRIQIRVASLGFVDRLPLFDSLFGKGKRVYHTGGYLKKGEVVWLLAKLPQNIVLPGEDKLDTYLLFSNCHDGTLPIDIRLTPLHFPCKPFDAGG